MHALCPRVQAQSAGVVRHGAQYASEQTEHAIDGGSIGYAEDQRAGLGKSALRGSR